MSASKDGGPAFPTPDCSEWDGELRTTGMTLRDYFAGQALISVIARNSNRAPKEWATDAYLTADAMLRERELE